MNLKTVIIFFMAGISLFCVSCVKQKNCDCRESGTFVYLKEPYEIKSAVFCRNKKVVAHFFPNITPDTIIDWNINDWKIMKPINGYVPPALRSVNPIRVNVCLKSCRNVEVSMTYPGEPIYSLKCIEKEEE